MAKLVTGGSGYIGSEVVRQLVNRGEEVILFDIAIHRHRIEDVADDVKIVTGDLGNFNEILNLFRDNKIDAVYHLGSMLTHLSENNPWAAFHSNVLGSYHVFEACRLFGVPGMVFASSIGTFGLGTGEIIDDWTIQRPTSFYGIGKLYCEGLGRWYANKFGLDFRSVRYSAMIGPGVRTPGHWAPAMIEDAILGKNNVCQYGSAESGGSWLYVTDAAKAAIDLLDAPRTMIQTMNYNITGIPESISARQAEEYLKQRYPGFQVIYQADPVLLAPRTQRRAGGPTRVYSDAYARKEWGWQPVYSTMEAIVARFEEDVRSTPKRYGLA